MSDFMTKQEILRAVAPCALCCHTCPGCKDGIIAKTAAVLHRYFEGYYEFQVKNFSEDWQPSTQKTKEFYDKLGKYSKPACHGCRDNTHGKCCIKGCFILECTQQHGVDFCAECQEFPCTRIYDGNVFRDEFIADWQARNERINKVGIEQYCSEVMSYSHYAPFKKDGIDI